jgi:hypothetical protein
MPYCFRVLRRMPHISPSLQTPYVVILRALLSYHDLIGHFPCPRRKTIAKRTLLLSDSNNKANDPVEFSTIPFMVSNLPLHSTAICPLSLSL